MKLVIDTDIFIDFLRGYTPSQEWFKKLVWEQVLFSAVSEAELLSGRDCMMPENEKKTLTLLQGGLKIPVTNEVARKAGEIRRMYDIPLMDSFIAATAILHEATVITRNVKHFGKVKEAKIKKPYE